MKHSISVGLAVCVLLSGCNSFSSKEKERLQNENDSLRVVQQTMEQQVNSYFESMNEISDNLQKVVSIGGYLSNQTAHPEGVGGNESAINENIELVAKIIEKSNAEIAQLKSRLKKSGLKMAELEKAIERLTAQLTEQGELVNRLQSELAEKNSLIASQRVSIETMRDDLEEMSADVKRQKDELARQTEELNSAWYVFGTQKELKAQQIVTREGVSKKVMEGDFNQDYFVKVDLRELSQIPLYSSRAKLLTTYPSYSYLLE